MYKNRSYGKTHSQKEKRSSGCPILLKIVSENPFFGKTYLYTIHPWPLGGVGGRVAHHEVLDEALVHLARAVVGRRADLVLSGKIQ